MAPTSFASRCQPGLCNALRDEQMKKKDKTTKQNKKHCNIPVYLPTHPLTSLLLRADETSCTSRVKIRLKN